MTHAVNTCNNTHAVKKERTQLMSCIAQFFAGMFETRQDSLYNLPPHIAARLFL